MPTSFRFLDDVALADLAFEAEGDSAEALVQAATDALMHAMADPGTVGASWVRRFERRDADLAALLFDWLSDVVYWKDAAGVVFSRVELMLTREAEQWTLTATLFGEPVDHTKQQLRDDVKGVTKHMYQVTEREGRWYARVVLDV